MILLTHIIIAISGLAVTGLSVFRPTSAKIKTSYALLAGTLLSGTLLILVNNASILHTCLSGLAYTAVMHAGILAAKNKLNKTAAVAN